METPLATSTADHRGQEVRSGRGPARFTFELSPESVAVGVEEDIVFDGAGVGSRVGVRVGVGPGALMGLGFGCGVGVGVLLGAAVEPGTGVKLVLTETDAASTRLTLSTMIVPAFAAETPGPRPTRMPFVGGVIS